MRITLETEQPELEHPNTRARAALGGGLSFGVPGFLGELMS